jgi:hypothetical protein
VARRAQRRMLGAKVRLDEGHGFSRAVGTRADESFSPLPLSVRGELSAAERDDLVLIRLEKAYLSG